ncbi:fumarylacetoacetate hydrolase family protein [bacterium]|nr:fumarylacetoacetate hydrolase family protein [bacterium]
MHNKLSRLRRVLAGEELVWLLRDRAGNLRVIESADDLSPTNRPVPEGNHRLLSPIAPGKIICLGRNYCAHTFEMGNEPPERPLLFFKPPSAVIGPGEAVVLPEASSRIDYEGEIAIVIGKNCHDAGEKEARECILGYTAFNDVTARDLQKKDGQWARAKGFDTFAPAGPEVVLTPPDFAWELLSVTTRVNGEVRQQGSVKDMAFSIPYTVSYISHIMTLKPGDVISTGTPEGVGQLVPGDTVSVEVSGLEPLENPVRPA